MVKFSFGRLRVININNIEVSQMFKNKYQSGFLLILYLIGKNHYKFGISRVFDEFSFEEKALKIKYG
jgi:hypothetical protein